MGEKKQRNSNFELLRILAIIMIILFHIQYHGTEVQMETPTELFGLPVFYKRLLIIEFIRPFGHIGNALFLMISGYFVADKVELNVGKISKKLLFQVGFATVSLMGLSLVWIKYFYGLKRFNYATDQWFKTYWWFIGWFMIVMVVAAVFLNRYLSKCDSKKYLMIILALFALIQFQWSGEQLESLISGLRVTLFGIVMYSIGGYIAKYNPFKNVRIGTFILLIVIVYGIKFVSNYNLTMQRIQGFTDDGTRYFDQSIVGTSNFEVLVLVVAVCIFEMFRRLRIPNSRIINYIGSSTLMIYMMHENDIFQAMYMEEPWLYSLNEGVVKYLMLLAKWTVIALITGVVAYSIYLLLIYIIKSSKWIFIRNE